MIDGALHARSMRIHPEHVRHEVAEVVTRNLNVYPPRPADLTYLFEVYNTYLVLEGDTGEREGCRACRSRVWNTLKSYTKNWKHYGYYDERDA